MSISQPKGETTLNRASVGGSRRVVYGLLYALSLFGLLLGAALIAVVIKITYTSISEIWNGVTTRAWTDNWLLVDLGVLVAAVVILIVSSIAAGKFKREGDEDITEVLLPR